MKLFSIYVLCFLSFSSFCQTKEEPAHLDSIVVKMKPWQQQDFESLTLQANSIREKIDFLLLGVVRENKVDDKQIINLKYRPGELILYIKKK